MRRGSPLGRKTPLRQAPLQSRRKGTGPSPDVVDAVYERAGHSCEACGGAVGPQRGHDHHLHHRRPRAAGGSRRPDTNLPSNLLLLCPPCHEGIESHRATAVMAGWLVPQVGDPAATAVLVCRDRWVYLTASGAYSIEPPREER
jgi:5-methylcytosine-specific restriction protein A